MRIWPPGSKKYKEEFLTPDEIDPKDLMAVERSTTALIGTSISLIVLGFVVEKFQLFLYLVAAEMGRGKKIAPAPLAHRDFYEWLGIAVVAAGVILAIYTYVYYLKWIDHLRERRVDTDKNVYFVLSIFVAFVGGMLLVTMAVF